MIDKRQQSDRRRRPTPPLSLFTIMGKRSSTGRRDGDKPGYVDLYHPILFVILISIVLLSFADAYFTLQAIGGGCYEVNPIMDWALNLGVTPFIVIKLTVTGIGILLLCLHKNFPRVKWIILTVLVGYVILILWHYYLMQFRIG